MRRLWYWICELSDFLIERFCDWVDEVTNQKELKDCDGCRFLIIDKRDGFRKCMRVEPPYICFDNGRMMRESKDDG